MTRAEPQLSDTDAPVIDAPAPIAGSGVVANPPAAQAHWTVGAWNGASRLVASAAKDQLIRDLIGAKARNQIAATVFGGTVMGAIAARVATRSVPGALLVGGALIAKAVYDQRKDRNKPPKT
ncbi:hypothetical protein C7451_107210 [Blastomonas natatoria]|uniref:Uncharacterized protein n=1 Tax=Blastomonas natatoria TaxID=34015 RepID=A0A2V3VF36_9SPHN|nr:hypothetical protein [Blastomonas natatoria]PXW75239.1 hypothetical protein C7451_107210 [Blastomonas natatoria]